jgi:hypothetical protein
MADLMPAAHGISSPEAFGHPPSPSGGLGHAGPHPSETAAGACSASACGPPGRPPSLPLSAEACTLPERHSGCLPRSRCRPRRPARQIGARRYGIPFGNATSRSGVESRRPDAAQRASSTTDRSRSRSSSGTHRLAPPHPRFPQLPSIETPPLIGMETIERLMEEAAAPC